MESIPASSSFLDRIDDLTYRRSRAMSEETVGPDTVDSTVVVDWRDDVTVGPNIFASDKHLIGRKRSHSASEDELEPRKKCKGMSSGLCQLQSLITYLVDDTLMPDGGSSPERSDVTEQRTPQPTLREVPQRLVANYLAHQAPGADSSQTETETKRPSLPSTSPPQFDKRTLETFEYNIYLLEEGLEATMQKTDVLKDKNEELAELVVDLKDDKAELADRVNELEDGGAKLRDRTDESAAFNVRLASSIMDLEEKNAELSSRVMELEDSNVELSEENSKLFDRVDNLSNRNRKLEGCVDELRDRNMKLTKRIDKQQHENNDLLDRVDTLEDRVSDLVDAVSSCAPGALGPSDSRPRQRQRLDRHDAGTDTGTGFRRRQASPEIETESENHHCDCDCDNDDEHDEHEGCSETASGCDRDNNYNNEDEGCGCDNDDDDYTEVDEYGCSRGWSREMHERDSRLRLGYADGVGEDVTTTTTNNSRVSTEQGQKPKPDKGNDIANTIVIDDAVPPHPGMNPKLKSKHEPIEDSDIENPVFTYQQPSEDADDDDREVAIKEETPEIVYRPRPRPSIAPALKMIDRATGDTQDSFSQGLLWSDWSEGVDGGDTWA